MACYNHTYHLPLESIHRMLSEIYLRIPTVFFPRSVGFSRDISARKPPQVILGNAAIPDREIAEISKIFLDISRQQIKRGISAIV
ncbi:hypothetical protein GQ43DRAFT_442129 [Delitschia confertaspora ATCC 74209]|uniref:Uncharacterized protein n=1 Tax=Delitschia confertaspora ATCC 74209 TaxID=1513339 RepID=A0A9P4JNR6_9PLEO|nr:hypothetical protein GQ43DRAFT_442129 [Delitschia confertaspora ATCC 74209]